MGSGDDHGPHDGYHGYHERSRNEFGLHMDSTEALFGTPMALGGAHNSMRRGRLGVVARDGIEPPTPAFSGLPTDPRKGLWNQRMLLIDRSFTYRRSRTIWD